MTFDDILTDTWRVVRVGLLVAIPVTILLFHVWTQYKITSLGYEVAEQTEKHQTLIEEKRKLSIEATYQGRTERILSVARERYGLGPLRPDQVVSVDDAIGEDDADTNASSEHAVLKLRE